MIGFRPFETFQLLAETDDIERANTLLKASCDAFVMRKKPDSDEIKQFEILASRLFQIATPNVRQQCAHILKNSENITPKIEELIITNIGEDILDYLATAPHISQSTIKSLIEKKNIGINSAIAKRTDLSNDILVKLFQTNSRKTYRSLAQNMSIKAQGAFLKALTRSAQLDYIVARTLAERNDFDIALLAPAFFDLLEEQRIRVIKAFSERKTPKAPIKKTIEQVSVASEELTKALMKLFSQNRRPEAANLIMQITGIDETKCAQIAHDESAAALFIILRSFGASAYDGLKVIIHATNFEEDRANMLAEFAKLFQSVSPDAMAFILSVWRNEVDLLELAKPQYVKSATDRSDGGSRAKTTEHKGAVQKTINALERIGARHAG